MTLPAPIRLVFCITELDAGGAERAMSQLVLSLDRNDWEPYVICLGPRGHFAESLEAANVPINCLNAKNLLSLPRVLYRLTQELRRRRPAIVQTFLFHANILGRIAARLAGIPNVVSGIRVAEHQNRWHGRIDRWSNFLVRTNVCVSQGVADFSEKTTGLDRKKLVVIRNSVDASRFGNVLPADLSPFGIPAGSRVFISIGRLERQKGIDILVEAVSLLSPIPPDVHFLVVGDGPEAFQLRSLAEQKQLGSRIHFVGRRDDVPQLLSASIALILPSRWEGMPNVVLEAMSAGRPVIATNVEGVSELVKEGETGLIVGAERVDELTAAIQTLLSDREFVQRAGRASSAIASNEFTVQATTESYVQLYRTLLESRGF